MRSFKASFYIVERHDASTEGREAPCVGLCGICTVITKAAMIAVVAEKRIDKA